MTLKHLEALDRLYLFEVKSQVKDMTPEEIRSFWGQVKPHKVGVGARAGSSKTGMKWNALLRKLLVVEALFEVAFTEAEEDG